MNRDGNIDSIIYISIELYQNFRNFNIYSWSWFLENPNWKINSIKKKKKSQIKIGRNQKFPFDFHSQSRILVLFFFLLNIYMVVEKLKLISGWFEWSWELGKSHKAGGCGYFHSGSTAVSWSTQDHWCH